MSDPWTFARRLTQARIGLGRAGHALPTREVIRQNLAHARARDAVFAPWDVGAFGQALMRRAIESVALASSVTSREEYLRRPDLGRALHPGSAQRLAQLRAEGTAPDVAMIVSNGLSSAGVVRHGVELVEACIEALRARDLTVSPVLLVPDARVALSDGVGAALDAKLAVIVLGERPGLSVDDSLGIYMTYHPRVGRTDAERNCISNVRPPQGLSYDEAAEKLAYLIVESLRRRLSGVPLKDESVLPPKADPARLEG